MTIVTGSIDARKRAVATHCPSLLYERFGCAIGLSFRNALVLVSASSNSKRATKVAISRKMKLLLFPPPSGKDLRSVELLRSFLSAEVAERLTSILTAKEVTGIFTTKRSSFVCSARQSRISLRSGQQGAWERLLTDFVGIQMEGRVKR